ncbi:MAG: pirin family protein [Flavobacteriales bacterium]
MNTNPTLLRIRPLGFQWATLDPFIFCVHHNDRFPKGNAHQGPAVPLNGRQKGSDFSGKDGWSMYHGDAIPGFPGHPHKGFETITVVRKGLVDHTDSMGASGRYGDGDVQWMTAGKGVQHAEMFPLVHEEKENPMELFQIWLNLPAKHKHADPYYIMFWKEKLPHAEYVSPNGTKVKAEIIAGDLWGVKALIPPPKSWAAESVNAVAIWIIHCPAGASFKLPAAAKGLNRSLYFYEGKQAKIADSEIGVGHAVDLLSESEIMITNTGNDAAFLLLQGKPIAEPTIQYGPFVMNTEAEIQQAFAEYRKTQFGGWPWPKYEMVHEKSAGRFAKYADGKTEKPQ